MFANLKIARKLLIAFGATGGLCLVLLLFGGYFSFSRPMESQLPPWFLAAVGSNARHTAP